MFFYANLFFNYHFRQNKISILYYNRIERTIMIIKCYNEHHPYLLFIDLEFFSSKKDGISHNHLVQFTGLLFQWIDDETYQLMKNAMLTDNSWQKSTQEYLKVYNQLLGK